jgi:hypothetical protein
VYVTIVANGQGNITSQGGSCSVASGTSVYPVLPGKREREGRRGREGEREEGERERGEREEGERERGERERG